MAVEKTSISEMSRKLLAIFSWLFLVPFEEYTSYISEHSKIN